jgi:hypothetical protein
VLAKARGDRVERRTSAAVICKVPPPPIAQSNIQAIDVVEQSLGNGVTVAQRLSG